jgi:hypothetical protein
LHTVLVEEQQPQLSLDGASEKTGYTLLDEGVGGQREEFRFVVSCWCHPPMVDLRRPAR